MHQGKVFGIGLSKTGTASLAWALNLLGIKTIHCPSDEVTFSELKSGNYRLSIMEKFHGAVDTPVVPFYPQLDKEFSGSKFILTVRNMDSWLPSMRRHFEWLPRWNAGGLPFFAFIDACVYGTLQFHEQRLRYVYNRHFRNVLHFFSNRPADLLILNICGGEGWEKLCPFLGVAVPEADFPKRNSSRGEDAAWTPRIIEAGIQKIREVLPAGARFALAGYKKIFVEIPGALDPGVPGNDREAIERILQLKENGIAYLVFLSPSLWWLNHYSEFHRYLTANFSTLLKEDHVVIFQLS